MRYYEKATFFSVIILNIIRTNGIKLSAKTNIPTVKEGMPVNTSTSPIKKYNTKPIIVNRRVFYVILLNVCECVTSVRSCYSYLVHRTSVFSMVNTVNTRIA